MKSAKVSKKETSITKTFSRGSVIVPINQRRARVLVDFLEPDSYDSFFKWGFFNNLFGEQGIFRDVYYGINRRANAEGL